MKPEVLGGFTLHRSATATIRVEAPDLVIIDGSSIGTIRFHRAQLRECVAMRVAFYRQRHDAAYAAGSDDEVVIRFQVHDAPQLLGPFPRDEGFAIADALALARGNLLFATPNLSVSIAADGAHLDIAVRGASGQMSVPVPTALLHELTIREAPSAGARHHIPTGERTSTSASHWIELVFWRGPPWSFGPMPLSHATTVAEAFRAWRAEHPIDVEPIVVDVHALAAAPSRWHLRRIDVTARWHNAFEQSSFVGAWLDVPDLAPVTDGTYLARVVGTWIYPESSDGRGYGHMGMWPGVMQTESIDVLEGDAPPHASPDGLTGLPRRDALGAAFARLSAENRPVCIALLDLDRLKRVNDTYGFATGDAVIGCCASAVANALRPHDVVVRWAGDEFAVLLPGTMLESAREILDRVIACIRSVAVPVGEERVGITLSAGVAEVMRNEAISGALQRADRALYEAKRAGRDCVAMASPPQ